MRKASLEIFKELQETPRTVSELAEVLDKNQGWVSELIAELENQNLVQKRQKVEVNDAHEARLLSELNEKYDITTLLAGKNEEILRELRGKPATPTDLETRGFASSTTYKALKDLRAIGAVEKDEDGNHRITDNTLKNFLEATNSGTEYQVGNQRIIVTQQKDVDGEPTGFSAFQRYSVEYYPAKKYLYQGDEEIGVEDILIHAVTAAEDRKQASMAVIFYLKHRSILDSSKLWKLANTWGSVEEWADTLAYADQRDVKQENRFLPWDEFTTLAQDYDVFLRGYHPEESLERGLERLGENLDTAVDAYLLGGGNLILRGLKDSTKDLDIVVDDREIFIQLGEALRELGYEERTDLEEAYKELDPAIVFQKEGSPRYDIFVETVAGKLQLTDGMKSRVDETREFGNLKLHLLSLTDILLFKSITEREGDFEDAALITRQGVVDWQQVLDEVKVQDDLTGQYFSFSVLDTLDILQERESIEPPIHRELVSYCLENALLASLQQPKTIEDLREELEFPDHRIYNKLRKLEESGEITVDRTGKLNEYKTVDWRRQSDGSQ